MLTPVAGVWRFAMHIVLAVVGLIGAAAFWWYRLKYMSDAANEAVDAVGRVQGHFRRGKLRKKSALAPISAIDDPVIAAATIMAASCDSSTLESNRFARPCKRRLHPVQSSIRLVCFMSPSRLPALTLARCRVATKPGLSKETSWPSWPIFRA